MGGRACVVRALPPAFRGRVLGARAGTSAVCVHRECVLGVPSFQERDGGGLSLVHLVFFAGLSSAAACPRVGHARAATYNFACILPTHLALRTSDTSFSLISSCAHAGCSSLCALGACPRGGGRGLRHVRLCSPGVLMLGEGGLGRTLGCGPACTIPHLIQNSFINGEH